MEGSIPHERNPRHVCSGSIAIPCAICLFLVPLLAHGQAVGTEIPRGWPAPLGREQLSSLGRDIIRAPDLVMMSDPVMPSEPAGRSSIRAALKAQANDVFVGHSSALPAPVFDTAVPSILTDPDLAVDEQPLPPNLAGVIDEPSTNLDDGESLGQAPQDNSLQFLRRAAVLLPQGDYQADIGLTYSHFEQDFFDPLAGANTTMRQRIMIVPLALRYGLTDHLQAFVSVPFGWANGEFSQLGQDQLFNHVGIGDVRVGATILVRESSGCGCDPTITATFGCTAPTGQQSFLPSLFGNPDINLGGGFWAASWNVLFIHSHDPIVTFYGLGSRHQFNRMMEGVHVSPGDEFLYQFGVGFAVNESVTLSTILFGQYITEPYLDGTRLEGLAREPMQLRFAATIVNGCHRRIMEPFATVGMTESAPSAQVGIVWTY